MGTLFAHGYGPDCLEKYSWDQIFLMIECLAERDAQRIDMVLQPIAGLFGAKDYSPGRVDVPGRGEAKPGRGGYADMSDQAVKARAVKRDSRILSAAVKWGIGVYDGPRKG